MDSEKQFVSLLFANVRSIATKIELMELKAGLKTGHILMMVSHYESLKKSSPVRDFAKASVAAEWRDLKRLQKRVKSLKQVEKFLLSIYFMLPISLRDVPGEEGSESEKTSSESEWPESENDSWN